ncbi:hypothetical protein SF83666_a43900 (plasmid) [Sinorhizobium fredii CCBAU 83666]|nr:hypothetical protein SF83666_a43900 [Sinorhizobium fredii CCBAU 83666]
MLFCAVYFADRALMVAQGTKRDSCRILPIDPALIFGGPCN